ncbi:MAG: hypothetical protein LBC74_05085 [Planctomycetaceae bacterium]|nr:hypothetical protein [Planctomycetaceae bacterium]
MNSLKFHNSTTLPLRKNVSLNANLAFGTNDTRIYFGKVEWCCVHHSDYL